MSLRAATAWLLIVLAGVRVAAQPAPNAQGLAESRVTPRLSTLRPENPEPYLLLAEEVLDTAKDADDRKLAIRLFVLAYERDRARGGTAVGASACLALAQLAPARSARSTLEALAREAAGVGLTRAPARAPAPQSTESTDYRVASLLGLIRAGDGARARQLLNRPEVAARLDALDTLLNRLGIAGGAEAIRREAEHWPCPQCGNKRIEPRSTAPGEFRLCTHCRGTPGPELTESQLLSWLRVETWLLQGENRAWSAQVAVDLGEPLPDADPASVSALFGIDPAASVWREGKWVAPAGAPAVGLSDQSAPGAP